MAQEQLDYLFQQTSRVSFFQAVLALERIIEDAQPVGHDGPAGNERLRLRPSLALSCPPSDLESIQPTGEERIQITATFLGLYGVDSPLPSHFAEHLAQIAEESRGERVRAFYDLFHHRLYSLLFRAWQKARATAIRLDRKDEELDPLHARVLACVGYLGQLDPQRQRQPGLFEARIRAQRARTTEGLEKILRHRLGYACTIEQLVRRVVEVPRDQLTRIGLQNSALGSTLLMGARITDCNKVCLGVHAESFAMFERLLPEGEDRHRLDQTAAGYLRSPLGYDVAVTLDAEHVPPWRLGMQGALARSTWLGVPRPRALCRWRGPN
jgi:type VI secretion system protein ImpH